MPRGPAFLNIDGLFEAEVLGTFRIIRGFASLQDLARISVPVLMNPPGNDGQVQGHQRALDILHAEDVKRYFEHQGPRFIPEVILSLRAPFTDITVGAGDARIQIGVSFDGLGISLRKAQSSVNLRQHRLRIELSRLPEMIRTQMIRRIDGNHRLEKAAELAAVSGQRHRYKAPFCLLLLGPADEVAHDVTEALIFHTINSTAKPLDAEHALSLILGQPQTHTMLPEQEFAFAPALHFTRLLDQRLRSLHPSARERLGGRALAQISAMAKELIQTYPARATTQQELERFAGEIYAAVDDVCTHLHAEFPDFCQADYFIPMAAHVWMRHASTATHAERLAQVRTYLAGMARWMGRDGLRRLSANRSLGQQLTEIYDSVLSRVPTKVFLARWYPDQDEFPDQKRRADRRFEQLAMLVRAELQMELIDLGTEAGGTGPIHQRMYELIESSEIFIADMTGLRHNVMIELGYALHHWKTGRLLLFFNPITGAETMPFDTRTFRYEQIDEAAEILGKLRPHLQEILRKARAGEI